MPHVAKDFSSLKGSLEGFSDKQLDAHFTLYNGYVTKLNEIEESTAPLGWCRGVLPVGEVACVGFSRLRPTRFRRNVRWVKRGLRRRSVYPADRVDSWRVRRCGLVDPAGLRTRRGDDHCGAQAERLDTAARGHVLGVGAGQLEVDGK